MNNRLLLLTLVGLLAIYGLTRLFSGKSDSSFNPEIIKVETDKVTKVAIRSKSDNFEEAVLVKSDGGWAMSYKNKTYPVSEEAMENLFTNLALVKTDFIAAKSADKWPEYELGDDQASHVTVYAGNATVADFFVGKFAVNQQAQQITSYFRLAGKNDVYAVEGMAGMMLGQGSAAYRSKKLLDLDISAIESLNYEGDAVYMAKRSGSGWSLGDGTALDTSTVQNFLMNLKSMSGDDFVDFDENLHSDKLLKKLTISGSNMPQPVVVRCWKDESLEKPFVIQSSQFPESFFASDSARLFTRLYKPVSEW